MGAQYREIAAMGKRTVDWPEDGRTTNDGVIMKALCAKRVHRVWKMPEKGNTRIFLFAEGVVP
ncbi:MAG: hypothetical protein OQJ76_03270, partial [Rhodospirillales bacterium]|nr:hypothetical protein [Rhodospirillales bacterium]